MKWVLNTYQTGQELSAERLIELCAATGYDGIEWLMDFNQPHGIEARAPKEHVRAVLEKARAAGLESVSFTSCAHFHERDPERHAENLDRARRTIALAAEFGVPNVRVLGDRVPHDDPAERERVLRQVTDSLRELGELAAAHGIDLSLEMHGSFADPDLAIPVIEAVAMPNVGVVFNCQWRRSEPYFWGVPEGASIRPLYERFRRHLKMIHTHQMERPEELPHYRELFALLKADGWDGIVCQEAAYRGPDPEKVLALYTALFRLLTA